MVGPIMESGHPKEAAKLYAPAAQFGDARSMKALGRLYSTGEAGRVDRVAAYVGFVRAATQGDQDALRAAGKLKPEMDKKEVDKAELQPIQAKIDSKKVNEALASLPNK